MAKELNYSVFVIQILEKKSNIGTHYQVKVQVIRELFTYEASAIAPTLMQAEDLAKKRALKLIGSRYYIKS